jgi:HEAT repeat protein
VVEPENIFLVEQTNQKDFVKIVDFGIALRASQALRQEQLEVLAARAQAEPSDHSGRLTEFGSVVGTPLYMSPEQASASDVDARADQYALGCILYEMLTGQVPFDGATPTSLMFKHVTAQPPPLQSRYPKLSATKELQAVVMRLLSKSREQRFPSMKEVVAELNHEIDLLLVQRGERVVLGKDAMRLVQSGFRGLSREAKQRVFLFSVVAATGVLVLAGAGLYFGQRYVAGKEKLAARLLPQELTEARSLAMQFLIDELRDPSAELRASVLSELGWTHDMSLRPKLEPLLADPNSEIAAQAAAALGELGDRQAIVALAAMADKPLAPNLHVAVAAALQQLGDPRGQKLLLAALDGAEPVAQKKAAYWLSEQGHPKAIETLLKVATHPELSEEQAIRLLGRLARGGDEQAKSLLRQRLGRPGRHQHKLLAAARLAAVHDEEGRRFLTELAAQSGAEQLFAARLVTTPESPVGLPLFRRVAVDRSATMASRQIAMEGLALSGESTDVRLLLPVLRGDPSIPMRHQAAIAIVDIAAREPTALSDQSLTWARLASDDDDFALRADAAGVLSEDSSGEAKSLLLRLAKDPVASVRKSAVRALGQRSDAESLAALHVGLTDSAAEVQSEALRALVKLTLVLVKQKQIELAEQVRTWLTEILRSSDLSAQLQARIGLQRLGDESQRAQLAQLYQKVDSEQRRQIIDREDGDRELWMLALQDDFWPLRFAAARRLAESGDLSAIPILREALTKTGSSAGTAYGLLLRLGEKVDPPNLMAQLSTTVPVEQRVAVVEGLLLSPLSVSLPLLLKAAKDPSVLVRTQAVEIAAQLPMVDGKPAGQPVLRLLSDDGNAVIRTRAAALLLRLLHVPQRSAQLAIPSVRASVEKVSKPDSVPAVIPTPLPATPDAGGVGADPLKSSPIAELARRGRRALETSDFAAAELLIGKAKKVCQRSEKTPGCAELSFELSFLLGRAHEAQGHTAEAMTEFERAMKLSPKVSGKAEEKSATQAAVLRLVPKLGVVMIPKVSGKTCELLSVWLPPGSHQLTVDNQPQTVVVKANQTVRAGSCP